MAKDMSTMRMGSVALLALLAGIFGGCQQTKSNIVAKLPAPNLDGPSITAPAPVAKAAPATRPANPPQTAVAAAQKSRGERNGVPQEWLINVPANQWQYIVIHHSATPAGNAASFDRMHKAKGWDELGYHFVIGNGTSTGNGQIEVGDRWRRQINGGHVHSDYLNNISLGICLVGDFNRDQPTRAQLDSCEELIRYLRERCGKVDRGNIPVRPHREMNPPRWATDCPGDAFPYSWFRRF